MEAITHEELMNVNGGLHVHAAGEGGSRRSWWSRNKKTVISYGRAVWKGFSGARAGIWIFRLVTGL
ncbi:MAG: hypothetical protein GXP33_12830 [Spirochaetes bacterium]|nr:hypothetical protein [Spirochaetota bacterium]